MDAHTANPDRLIFEATVQPHRSLDRKGVLMAAGVMVAGSLIVTSMMAMIGAWVVIGFNGADIALALFLLWLNVRAARARELLVLTETKFTITRTDMNGRTRNISLPPYWLNVVLEERAGTVPKLLLSARGVSQEVAHQLGEAQKRDLAAALTRALYKWRNPVFHNPQLQD
ncbi:MAG TPA: DUF2244 domain-containing protein [Acidocella sp.]|nr:MAG: hypothetical protein B7Z77_04955 [Acidocella sp. 20-58-15]OYY04097.1 MAG: hypothetical protein B7Y73_05160 [Acidocella sp. 35-58-6]HQT40219.1 DUF2244 domain-containing protein [Acidocella sp.]